MLQEIITFANFEFSLQKVTSKVLVGDGIITEERIMINWREYQQALEDLGLNVDFKSRPFWQRYLMPRTISDCFDELKIFQSEIIEFLAAVAERKIIPKNFWQKIFKESDGLAFSIQPARLLNDDWGPDDLSLLSFEFSCQADTYRTFIMSYLRQLIITNKIFLLAKNQNGFYWLNPEGRFENPGEPRPFTGIETEINNQPEACHKIESEPEILSEAATENELEFLNELPAAAQPDIFTEIEARATEDEPLVDLEHYLEKDSRPSSTLSRKIAEPHYDVEPDLSIPIEYIIDNVDRLNSLK